MAKKRSERLQVVLKVALRDEQEAARYVAQYQRQLQAERDQLAQLEQYRSTYQQDYADPQKQHSPDVMMRYSDFLQRLSGAIDEQNRTLESAYEQCQKVQQHWQVKRHKRQSLESLITRLSQSEEAEQERKLQKEIDDLVNLKRPPHA
jgi:flagellar FliJ protein